MIIFAFLFLGIQFFINIGYSYDRHISDLNSAAALPRTSSEKRQLDIEQEFEETLVYDTTTELDMDMTTNPSKLCPVKSPTSGELFSLKPVISILLILFILLIHSWTHKSKLECSIT